MQIEQYLIFGEAARAASFSGAARKLGVSNSHVSKHIARLEHSLGYQLFSRSPRLQLTAAGEALLPVAMQMIEQYEALTLAAPALKSEVAGVVRISLPPLLARECVAPYLAAFLREHPQLRLEITLQQTHLSAFSKHLDLLVTLGDLPDSSLVSQRLGECDPVLVATPDYLSAHGVPTQPQDLAGHHCLASHYSSATAATQPWRFVGQGQRHTVVVQSPIVTNDIYTVRTLVKDHMGIGALLRFFVQAELDSGQLVEVLPDYDLPMKQPVQLVYHDRQLLPKSVKTVQQFLAVTIGRYFPS